jgi:flagellar motor protein MotB
MKGQVGKQVDMSIDFHSLIQRLESVIKPEEPRDRGDSNEEGIYGKHFRLRKIRDGMEITIGGPVLFEPFSAKLSDAGRVSVSEVGKTLTGHRNRVEVRGHASEEPQPADWTYEDAVELSFQRAKAVANELMLRGVDPRCITLVAVGSNEPVARGVYDSSVRGQNRRVEIVIRESLIDDYLGQDPAGPVATTQPGVGAGMSSGG